MTDNEIIKALECCMFITPNKKCNECPKDNEGVECSVELHRHALDLINRQQAEIERFEKEKDSKLVMCIANDKDKIKSESIKDFSERLLRYTYGETNNIISLTKTQLKNLIKEMTEV